MVPPVGHKQNHFKMPELQRAGTPKFPRLRGLSAMKAFRPKMRLTVVYCFLVSTVYLLVLFICALDLYWFDPIIGKFTCIMGTVIYNCMKLHQTFIHAVFKLLAFHRFETRRTKQ